MNNKNIFKKLAVPVGVAMIAAMSSTAQAAIVDVTVTIENLAPENTVSFAPLRLGFHNGTFDAFDINGTPGPAITSVAEGGGGEVWFEQFAAAEPGAVLGSVVNGGPALPSANAGVGNPFSATASNTFRVDTSDNAFFTFANMVIPTNDLFLGNDNPLQLFDASGNLLFDQIVQTSASIWDNNSEVANPLNGAFVVGGNNDARIEEGGVVEFDFSELAVFDGVETPAGYNFDFAAFSNLDINDAIYTISFEANIVQASAPSALALLGLAGFGLAFRRAKK